ncbi:hypothetical protein DNHGIG_03530 [Collibacillus ludicampi]|jgi:8-oxo-dGTP diphosphatase|uniref:Nudix hydrolase domain-containing protein n=1 Tax=Collibacillus ludicampi TaxID=2771369 RepID=A0AAV4LAE0_9BACL|nr:NUDIX domain-containing protein [Collibacillus ludicampi]GIM44804.1 hypothetical protein DNHGIG_03530 [Collibacillus ludicampi]
MLYEFSGAYGGRVTLTFERDRAKDPSYVLIFPFFRGQLLMAKHMKRGWEVPGGTMEPGEMPICTAIRETYEETGAELDAIEWIAQYTVREKGKKDLIKSVYIARVAHLQMLPSGFETTEVRLFKEWPAPEDIRSDQTYSPIMKDDVYLYVINHIRRIQHPFTHL